MAEELNACDFLKTCSKLHVGQSKSVIELRIPAMYEVKKTQQNLQLLDILACNSANKPFVRMDQNIQKCCICLMHSRYP